MVDTKFTKIETWKFAGDKKICDKLFNLVKTGEKTATSYLYEDDLQNNLSILTNWKEDEKLLLKTTKIEVKSFSDVSEEFAFKEGENDKSLKSWRKIHKRFFKKRCKVKNIKFNENVLIVCEEFEVVQEDCYGKKKI